MPRSRRCCGLLGASCVVAMCSWLTAAEPATEKSATVKPNTAAPTIRQIKDAAGQVIALEASPLPPAALARLSQRPDSTDALAHVLSVSVDRASAGDIAIVGSYSLDEQTLRFTPQFAFRKGQPYRAVLRPSQLEPTAAPPGEDVTYRFCAPADVSSPPAEVTAIFPSAAVVPENQLRFYVHFSAPMARGAAYDHVRLLDNQNRPVDMPFLELGEELWDPRQQRLTLLIDPGRIKRGVKPREDLGPVLRAGEEFTLAVQSSWPDAQDRPLRKESAKHFRVGPPIDQAIDPAQWQISVPSRGSREPLTIDFPRPLDHALLQRMLTVRSASGKLIAGEAIVSREERRWELRPTDAWPAGRFELVVDSALEDLAGNRIGRAFEAVEFGPASGQVRADAVRLGFEILATP